jgi:hypothetical protein
MTLEETQRRNDELRTMFKGGRVLMTSTVYEQLPAEIRGRMLYRLTLFNHFHPESDHSEGVCTFAGYTHVWKIQFDNDERTLTIYAKDDLARAW